MDPFDALVELSGCVEAQFAEDGRPGVCFNGVIPGDGVTALWSGECENDLCGMTWVRMVQAYPAKTVGVLDQSSDPCDLDLGMDVEVGVLRCTTVLIEDAETEETESLEVSNDIMADMMSLRRAILCCFSASKHDRVLGSWTPMGPMGQLVGGVWTVYLAGVQ